MEKNTRLNDSYDLNSYFLLLLSIFLSFSFPPKCGKLKVQDKWVHDANCVKMNVYYCLCFSQESYIISGVSLILQM